ncbi:hypothetical protein VDGD_09429 [Verticillium dahliae]|nr:hypothetical protein VdG1_00680 [Verticillium dahliae VDG1]RBQ82388.1 hypothetical protein VDGD_09429 [Verticillium dahliae]
MAHIDHAAIFSPSVARIAASTAKDWSFVDTWLASKFPGRAAPSFERNPDTLRVLLSLASLNETADEERQLFARAEASALRELSQAADRGADHASIQSDLLEAIEEALPQDGRNALDALASLAVDLGNPQPTPHELGVTLVQLQAQAQETEERRARLKDLQSHVDAEKIAIADLLHDLQGWKFKPSAELPRQNVELQRKIKALSNKLPELEDRLKAIDTAPAAFHPTIDQIAREESAYTSLLNRKMDLDSQIAPFAGLPDDADAARDQLEALRSELQSITRRRDAVFESLVERESPRKRS